MWMGLIQLVGGVKRKGQGFLEKEFSHKTNMILSCEFLACWPAWGDQGDCSRLLRDAGVIEMPRKPRASSPLSNIHPPMPKRQPGREKGPVKEVPGTKASP
uniref:Uncharacterized protein n=1 Tax=Rhinopithecus bieti TaxID=61621 RepID=A0A2K6L8W6_RHIBE